MVSVLHTFSTKNLQDSVFLHNRTALRN